jgi:hypothetical protein
MDLNHLLAEVFAYEVGRFQAQFSLLLNSPPGAKFRIAWNLLIDGILS